MIRSALLAIGLLSAALCHADPAPVSCANNSECYPFEYCWNDICRELPADRMREFPGMEDYGRIDDSDDPIAGLDDGGCRGDSGCFRGQRCQDGRCVQDACEADRECGYHEICRRRRRADQAGHCTLVACTDHWHCGAAAHCRNGACRPGRRRR